MSGIRAIMDRCKNYRAEIAELKRQLAECQGWRESWMATASAQGELLTSMQSDISEAREREAGLTRLLDKRGTVLEAAQVWMDAHYGSQTSAQRRDDADTRLYDAVTEYSLAALRESEKEARDE